MADKDDNELKVSFTPQAIREHFEELEEPVVRNLSDEELRLVGLWAIQDDRLWQLFHELLTNALLEQHGIDIP